MFLFANIREVRFKEVDLWLISTSIQKWCTDSEDNNLPCCFAFDNDDMLPSAYYKQRRGLLQGWRRRGRQYSNTTGGARRQGFEAAEWSWPGGIEKLYGRSPSTWFRLIMNISNRSCDHEWWRGVTTVATRSRHFFSVCLTVFTFEFWPRTFTNSSILRKKKLSDQSFLFWNEFSIYIN